MSYDLRNMTPGQRALWFIDHLHKKALDDSKVAAVVASEHLAPEAGKDQEEKKEKPVQDFLALWFPEGYKGRFEAPVVPLNKERIFALETLANTFPAR